MFKIIALVACLAVAAVSAEYYLGEHFIAVVACLMAVAAALPYKNAPAAPIHHHHEIVAPIPVVPVPVKSIKTKHQHTGESYANLKKHHY
ncbi:conserved hypothetical protein [Culex quinquefasciatus]|uniref:Uncharacterized protein n=1 Tax=Culex quinquefasciatus TaxID=7176 RepID=B0W886_CULQU|nr:conserved hypothetical protein [Culex quinquefasciatus]|eukprot:XP_001844920.1 conserved hypothetical protein [Culex quinquefasciatus]